MKREEERAAAQDFADRRSNAAVLWGVLGIVLPVVGVFAALLALVYAWRARTAIKMYRLESGTRATLGIGLGAFSLLSNAIALVLILQLAGYIGRPIPVPASPIERPAGTQALVAAATATPPVVTPPPVPEWKTFDPAMIVAPLRKFPKRMSRNPREIAAALQDDLSGIDAKSVLKAPPAFTGNWTLSVSVPTTTAPGSKARARQIWGVLSIVGRRVSVERITLGELELRLVGQAVAGAKASLPGNVPLDAFEGRAEIDVLSAFAEFASPVAVTPVAAATTAAPPEIALARPPDVAPPDLVSATSTRGRYDCKTLQSEAKTMLSFLFTAEKEYYGHAKAFTTDLSVLLRTNKPGGVGTSAPPHYLYGFTSTRGGPGEDPSRRHTRHPGVLHGWSPDAVITQSGAAIMPNMFPVETPPPETLYLYAVGDVELDDSVELDIWRLELPMRTLVNVQNDCAN